MLQSLDYKFDLAKNGEEAIAFYKRYMNIGRPYDAVIMDLTVVGGMGDDAAEPRLQVRPGEKRRGGDRLLQTLHEHRPALRCGDHGPHGRRRHGRRCCRASTTSSTWRKTARRRSPSTNAT